MACSLHLEEIRTSGGRGRWRTGLVAQCVALSIATAMLAVAPPASGAMLLVPLAATGGDVVNLALARGARLLGAGPLPGSIVVTGRRDALAGAMLRHGTLTVAASPLLCGALPRPDAAVRS